MKNLNKKLIPIIAIIMAVVTVAGIILAAVLPKGNTPDDGTAFNELFTKDVLENMKVDDIVSDPKWGENLADATDGYIMVDANKFEFQEKVGAGNGYSKLYYNEKSKDIEMIEHSYVTYTNEKDPKEEINKIIANIQCDISGLLGEPAKSFMLMNTSGEFVDYEGLTVDEMVDEVNGTWVYDNNGSSSSVGTHHQNCSRCGTTMNAGSACSRGGLINNGSNHYDQCSKCGGRRYFNHSWYETSRSGTSCTGGTIYYKCSGCGATTTGSYGATTSHNTKARCNIRHTATWTSYCSAGGTHKWNGYYHILCSNCGQISDNSAKWCAMHCGSSLVVKTCPA